YRLWPQHSRHVPPCSKLRGQNPQGCQTRGLANRAADQVRVGHQPQDCQAPRADDPADVAAAGGPDHRMMNRRTCLCLMALGALAGPLTAEAQRAGKVPEGGGQQVPTLRRGLNLSHWFAQARSALGYSPEY